jgi:phosphoglycolate/pyridoxal phosphate phosphatase family enzyme
VGFGRSAQYADAGSLLREVDGLVCDLDGVVYRGDEPLPGTAAAIARVGATGVGIVYCTNNSRPTVAEYVAKLARMGITVEERDIVTSGVVAADALRARGFAGKLAIVVGGEGVRTALQSAGLRIVEEPSVIDVDAVVVGLDTEFDYRAMHRAAAAVRAGATLIATNDDATYPGSDAIYPGAGAILASIETASGARAEIVGKPHRPMMEAAAARFRPGARLAMVGDRPETDLAGANAMGWKTVLVLTGVTRAKDVPSIRPAPDMVVPSLAALAADRA